jgi:hypothetical protein
LHFCITDRERLTDIVGILKKENVFELCHLLDHHCTDILDQAVVTRAATLRIITTHCVGHYLQASPTSEQSLRIINQHPFCLLMM